MTIKHKMDEIRSDEPGTAGYKDMIHDLPSMMMLIIAYGMDI